MQDFVLSPAGFTALIDRFMDFDGDMKRMAVGQRLYDIRLTGQEGRTEW